MTRLTTGWGGPQMKTGNIAKRRLADEYDAAQARVAWIKRLGSTSMPLPGAATPQTLWRCSSNSKQKVGVMRMFIQQAVIVGCGTLLLLSAQANAQGYSSRETIIQGVRDDVRRKIDGRNVDRAAAANHQWHHHDRAERH
jgi:hypothetical protein